MNRPRLGRSDPRRGPQASFPGQSGQWGPLGRSARRGAPPARPRRKRLVTRFRVVGMRGGQPPRGAPRAAAPSATRGSKVSHAELWPPGVEIEPRGGAGGAGGAAFCGALGVAPSASSSGARRAPGPPRARAAPAAPHTPPISRLKRRRARGEAARRAATPPARLGLSEAFPRPWQPGEEIPTTSQLGQRRAGRAWRPARGRGAVRCELRGMVAGGGRHRSETKTLKCAPGCLKGCQGDQMQYLQKTPPSGEVKGTLQGRRRAVRRRARRSVGVV